jgi:hypothetical protein
LTSTITVLWSLILLLLRTVVATAVPATVAAQAATVVATAVPATVAAQAATVVATAVPALKAQVAVVTLVSVILVQDQATAAMVATAAQMFLLHHLHLLHHPLHHPRLPLSVHSRQHQPQWSVVLLQYFHGQRPMRREQRSTKVLAVWRSVAVHDQ